MKKVIILFGSILVLIISGCSQNTQPKPPTSRVKTIKVVDHQVSSKKTYNFAQKKPPKKFSFFVLPRPKKEKLVYTNSNNILNN